MATEDSSPTPAEAYPPAREIILHSKTRQKPFFRVPAAGTSLFAVVDGMPAEFAIGNADALTDDVLAILSDLNAPLSTSQQHLCWFALEAAQALRESIGAVS